MVTKQEYNIRPMFEQEIYTREQVYPWPECFVQFITPRILLALLYAATQFAAVADLDGKAGGAKSWRAQSVSL